MRNRPAIVCCLLVSAEHTQWERYQMTNEPMPHHETTTESRAACTADNATDAARSVKTAESHRKWRDDDTRGTEKWRAGRECSVPIMSRRTRERHNERCRTNAKRGRKMQMRLQTPEIACRRSFPPAPSFAPAHTVHLCLFSHCSVIIVWGQEMRKCWEVMCKTMRYCEV